MTLPRTLIALSLFVACCSPFALQADEDAPIAIVIHAGAGTISREDLDADQEREIRAKLEEAVRAGYALLQSGEPGLLAVAAAVRVLEDSPLFNAGKGAVFNSAGYNEMDASVMDGATLKAGAVAALQHVRNPIDLAMAVMNHSRHVMMIGEGAEQFAVEQGFELVDRSYFQTEHRRQQLIERQADETAMDKQDERWYSTVGALVLDRQGNLAAGTSTGGLTNKRWGRVGDTPIIGAGTYANNESCAVSATGTGEYFIRYVVAHSICERVRAGATIAEAASALIHDVLKPVGGDGGVIAMDAGGNIAMPHNTAGMYRASINTSGQLFVGIYGDE